LYFSSLTGKLDNRVTGKPFLLSLITYYLSLFLACAKNYPLLSKSKKEVILQKKRKNISKYF